MQTIMKLFSVATVVGIGVAACSDSTSPVDSGVPTDSAVTDSPSVDSAAVDSSNNDASAAATLTVMNFLDWCSVSINGGTASTGATVTASVTSGSVASIVVSPSSSAFQIGTNPWLGVDQNNGGPAPGTDVGSGTSETSTATVTITKTAQCVSVCCQQPNNSPTPCPTTNPCP